MTVIEVKELSKVFNIPKKEPGFSGAQRAQKIEKVLVHRDPNP